MPDNFLEAVFEDRFRDVQDEAQFWDEHNDELGGSDGQDDAPCGQDDVLLDSEPPW